jgi:hypothetical protein
MNYEGRFVLELCRTRLMDLVRGDLAAEPNEQLALRKALITLIMMTQDGATPIAKKFIEYLIQEFPPLARYFSGTDDHPFLDNHTVGRRYSEDDGGIVLALKKNLVDSILKEPVNSDELALIAELIPWELTSERYVGFYDIMGFRAFVNRHQHDHDALHRIMRELHDIGVHAEEMHPHDGGGVPLVFDYRGSQLRIIQFSDSIIALTRDASSTSSLLIELVLQMFFLHALRSGTVLRGAIAYGTITADFERSIFFGQPIVDAYLLEEEQAWYGIVKHSTAVQTPENDDIKPLGEDDIPLTVSYRVPLKSSDGIEIPVINWPVFCEDHTRLDELLSHLRNEDSEKLNGYYRLTRAFGHAMLRRFRS